MTSQDPGDGPALRIALVDDHPLVRSGLAGLLRDHLGVHVVGEAADGADALELVERTQPDLLLMDLSMPGVDGIAATREVRAVHPALPILILTSSREGEKVREALAAGASGYLVKDAEPQEISAAVRAAARGEAPVDPRVARSLFPGEAARAHSPETPEPDPAPAPTRAPAAAPDPAPVRGREADVLRLLARGLANKQIARELGISERTVKVHVGSVFRRLGVNDRVSAALWARANGY